MVSVFSKVAARNSGLLVASVGVIYWISTRRIQGVQKKTEIDEVSCAYSQKEKKKEKIKIDAQFLRELKDILKIIIPKFFSRETVQIILVTGLLIGRTWLDTMAVSDIISFERSILNLDVSLFRETMELCLMRLSVVGFLTSSLKLSIKELACLFRSRLTKHLYDKYLRGITYYKMSNLDNRISNPEQHLSQDVSKFCTSIVHLFANTTKPILDVILITYYLSYIIGPQIPLILLTYSAVVGLILTRLRRPVGEMTATEQKLEGELRYVNSRLITNSEEVAFYHGNKREKTIIIQALQRLVNHLRQSMYFDFVINYLDIIAKYTTSLVTLSAVFLQFRNSDTVGNTYTDRFEAYNKCKTLLMQLSEVISRLIMATHNLTQLAGLTARITKIMTVLEDLNKGSYVRTMIGDSKKKQTDNAIAKNRPLRRPGIGVIINQDNIIKFDRVPLMTPNGEVIAEDLSFEVKSGMNVLVHGPNGCGKSSLFRILGELWPLFGGVLTKPTKDKLFYIPQRPYMTLGTLRDQIIYPDTQDDMKKKGMSDIDLEFFLEMVQLTYLLEREADWNSIKDWMDQLSGGEKQRIAMARLFYHRPQFAILDECTSAVSVDVEGSMYQYCKEVGITLFTVSHRRSLWKHHEFTLYMDGQGGYKFQAISEATLAEGS